MKRKAWYYVQLALVCGAVLFILVKLGRHSQRPSDEDLAGPVDNEIFDQYARNRPKTFRRPAQAPFPTITRKAAAEASPDPANEESDVRFKDKVNGILASVLDAEDTTVERMLCPAISAARYDYLKPNKYKKKHQYLIAITLRQCVDLLPRLLGSVMEVINYLGREHVVLSIVEGNSDDGTSEVLDLLRSELRALGVAFFLVHSDINPSEDDRIARRAQLRALAVKPLTDAGPKPAGKKAGGGFGEDYDNEDHSALYGRDSTPGAADLAAVADELDPEPNLAKRFHAAVRDPEPNLAKRFKATLRDPVLNWAKDPTVIFLNDVAACADDILELIHQRLVQRADMTCAMDWTHRPHATFYGVWASRTITGDLFFAMPGGSWEHSLRLFPTDKVARARFRAHRPFQVFSCWNGATVFTGAPLLEGKVRFRAPKRGECFQSEVQLFCKDMWFKGKGRIAVVPSVNLEYSDARGRETKEELGYAAEWVAVEDDDDVEALPLRIDWQGPPDEVLCSPDFVRQEWMAWNESLVPAGSA